MDITAPLTQPTDAHGDGALLAADNLVAELTADQLELLAEFQAIAEEPESASADFVSTELVSATSSTEPMTKEPLPDEFPQIEGHYKKDLREPDIIAELMAKMTGVTGEVSDKAPTKLAIPEVALPLPMDRVSVSENTDKTYTEQNMLSEIEKAEELARNISQDVLPDAALLPLQPFLPRSKKDLVVLSNKAELAEARGLLNAKLTEIPFSPRSTELELVSNEAPISDPARNSSPIDFVPKPNIVNAVEPKIFPTNLSDPSAEAPQTRVQAELRPVQVNPPAVFRQISDVVVTMRDEMVEIRLSPEELGRIRMVLTGQDRAPHLTIWVDRPEVLEQLRRQGDGLLQQLRDQGMSGASLDFRDGKQSESGDNPQENFNKKEDNNPESMAPIMALPPRKAIMTPFLSGNQGIDIRV